MKNVFAERLFAAMLDNDEIGFLTGSQHRYGPEARERVGQHSQYIIQALGSPSVISTKIVCKSAFTTPEEIHAACTSGLD